MRAIGVQVHELNQSYSCSGGSELTGVKSGDVARTLQQFMYRLCRVPKELVIFIAFYDKDKATALTRKKVQLIKWIYSKTRLTQ